MSTRGRRILIGVAVVLGILVFLGRGCWWIVSRLPEQEVVEIKRDRISEFVAKATQLADNDFSKDLVFDYRQVGQQKGERLKNGSRLIIPAGIWFEGHPWKRGYNKSDGLLYDPPFIVELTPADAPNSGPCMEGEGTTVGRERFRGIRSGGFEMIILILEDDRVKKHDPAEKYIGAVIINITVTPAQSSVQPKTPDPQHTGLPHRQPAFIINR